MAKKTIKQQAEEIVANATATAELAKNAQLNAIKQLGAYIQTTIKNGFREGYEAKKKKGRPFNLYQPNGELVSDMATWLKGAYVASGNGSFKKEKVQSPKGYRGQVPKGHSPLPGTYAYENQKPGEFFDKGTGKFSQAEKGNIAECNKAKRSLTRQIRRIQRERNRQLKIAMKQRLGDRRRAAAAAKAEAYRKQQLELAAKRREMMTAKRDHTKRIIAPNKDYVPAKDVRAFAEYRSRSKPGKAPKSWGPQHFLRNHVLYDVDENGITIFMNPTSSGDMILKNLEEGVGGIKKRSFRIGEGNYKEVGEQIGYTIESEASTNREQGSTRKRIIRYSHRRYKLKRRYADDPPIIRIAPRPFWQPAKDRLSKSVPKIFGEVQSALSQLTFGK